MLPARVRRRGAPKKSTAVSLFLSFLLLLLLHYSLSLSPAARRRRRRRLGVGFGRRCSLLGESEMSWLLAQQQQQLTHTFSPQNARLPCSRPNNARTQQTHARAHTHTIKSARAHSFPPTPRRAAHPPLKMIVGPHTHTRARISRPHEKRKRRILHVPLAPFLPLRPTHTRGTHG